MKGNKVLITVLVLLLVLLAGLGVLFLWLTGGTGSETQSEGPPASGVVHVRSIYTVDGKNLARPVGIGAADDGSFFVTLRDDQKIVEFDAQGDFVRYWGERGMEQGQMLVPIGVAVDRLANHVYVTDRSRLRLLCYDTQGKFLWEVPLLNPIAPVVTPEGVVVLTFGPMVVMSDQGEVGKEVGSRGPSEGQFDYPRAAVPFDGDLIVADSNNNRVQRVEVSGDGTATAKWVSGTPSRFQDDPDVLYGLPTGVALDDEGRAFVLDGFKHTIVVLDAETGERLHTFDDLQGKSDARFNLPTAIAYLGSNTFAITDTYNDRVQIVRLLLPGEDTPMARYPWLWWLLPAAILAVLAWLLTRKRYFATREAMELAADEGQLRLLAAVARRLHVLPGVHTAYESVVEEGVRIGEYLVAVDAAEQEDEVAWLISAQTPEGWRRFISPRVLTIVADESQADAFAGAPGRRIVVGELSKQYTIGGDARAPRSAAGPADAAREAHQDKEPDSKQ